MAIKILKSDIKKFTHIVHMADIHIRLLKRYDEYEVVFNRLYEEIKKTPDTTVICLLGDIFHNKVDLSPECIQCCKNFFISLGELRPTVLVAGNHDANLTNKNRLDSLTPIVDALNLSNLHYLRDSGLYSLGNICFNNYSVFDESEKYIKGSDIPSIYKNEYDYFVSLFHGPVHGAMTDIGFKVDNKSSTISMFDDHDLSLLGDIHMIQDLQKYDDTTRTPTVHYCGSLIQQNHGESLNGHGFSLWNLKERSSKHIEIKNDYGYFTVKLDKGEIVTDLNDIPKKVRLRVQCFETVPTQVKAALSKIQEKSEVFEPVYSRIESSDSKESISDIGVDAIVGDISNRDHQIKLLTDYLNKKLNVTDQSFIDKIISVNDEVNSFIKKSDFCNNIRWRPIKFEWDNLFSYGEGNVIDFTKLKDVVGLFANNAEGKSTIFSALTFCIFDKCDRESKAGNILNTQKMGFKCKFQFEIGNVQYFIQRIGTSDKKGNVKVDVKFCKIENNKEINLKGEDRRDTNDIIRDYIGTYDDFVLTSLSVQKGKNIKSFIDMGNTERKDLLAQFLGLNIFDQLYSVANTKLNELVTVLKTYKNEDFAKRLIEYNNILSQSKTKFQEETEVVNKTNEKKELIQHNLIEENKKLIKINTNISSLTTSESRKKECEKIIDENSRNINDAKSAILILNSDIQTVEIEIKKWEDQKIEDTRNIHQIAVSDRDKIKNNITNYKSDFSRKNDNIKNSIEKLMLSASHKKEKIKHSEEYQYDSNCTFCMKNAGQLGVERESAKQSLEKDKLSVKKLMDEIKESEFKEKEYFDKINIELSLSEKKVKDNEWVVAEYAKFQKLLTQRNKMKDTLIIYSEKFNKSQSTLDHAKENLKIEENNIVLYNKNKNDIEFNLKVEEQVKIIKRVLENEELLLKVSNRTLVELNGNISIYNTKIEEIQTTLTKIKEIEELYKIYETYTKSVSRDGIPYEVISVAVPEIEREVNNILSHIVEFHSKFEVDGKNIIPFIAYDQQKWLMSLGSGMEQFILSIAIRVALTNISNLPRMSGIVIDEGFGVLDSENLSSVSRLFSYLKSKFDFIIIVSHLDYMKDIVDNHIELKKENGFSKVNYI